MVRLCWYRLASEPRLIHAHVPMPLAALGSSAARTRTIATSLHTECVLLHGPRLRGPPRPRAALRFSHPPPRGSRNETLWNVRAASFRLDVGTPAGEAA